MMMKLLGTLFESKIHGDNLNVRVYDRVSGAPALAYGSIFKFIFNFLYGWHGFFGFRHMHIYSHVFAHTHTHTHTHTGRKHKQGFSKLSRQFSEWVAKLKLISFCSHQGQKPISASPAWCLTRREVNVDVVYLRKQKAVLFWPCAVKSHNSTCSDLISSHHIMWI